MPSRIHPLPKIGEIKDDLQVTEIYHDRNNNVRIKAKCIKCGREKDMFFSAFRKRTQIVFHKTCGSNRDKTKGLASQHKRFHRLWMSMKSRIYNQNGEHYHYYGGKGIKCDEFDLFIDFYDLMYESYLEAVEKYGDENQVSLDRIDPDGDYCKNNCRWISKYEQEQNKLRNRWFLAISPSNERFFDCNKARFSREHNIKRVTINNALIYEKKNRQGWKFRYLTEEEIAKYKLNNKLSSVKCNDYSLV